MSWPSDWPDVTAAVLRSGTNPVTREALEFLLSLVDFRIEEHRAILFAGFMLSHGRGNVASIEQPKDFYTPQEMQQTQTPRQLEAKLLGLPWRQAGVNGCGRGAGAFVVDFICFGIFHLENPIQISAAARKFISTRWSNKTIGHFNYAKVGMITLEKNVTKMTQVVRSGRATPNWRLDRDKMKAQYRSWTGKLYEAQKSKHPDDMRELAKIFMPLPVVEQWLRIPQ